MNIYSLLLFTSFLIYLYLGFQMFRIRPMPRLSRIFCILCFAFAHWSFCITFLFPAPHKEAASFWMKCSSLGWSFIPALLLHFSLILSGWEQKFKHYILLPLLYLPGVLFIWREMTAYVTAKDFVLMSYGWTGVTPTDSPWVIGFTLYYLIFVLSSTVVLYKWRKKTESPREKKQAQIIIVAVLCSVILTFINETLLPLMGIHSIPRIPSFFILIWALGMWYAITKYRLMDLSHSFTGEIVLEELLEKLLKTILENSGAKRVVILLEEDGEMLIQGEVDTSIERCKVLHHIPLKESSALPCTLLKEAESTSHRLLIDDALKEEASTLDPYIQKHRPRSILLWPLLSRGELMGLLYLENNTTPYTFTPERVEILQRITSQVIVSLENATLFSSLQRSHDRLSHWNQRLEETVKERTTAIKILLDNAGQGFLSFGQNMLVDEEYSVECENLLGESIGRESFPALIYPHHREDRELLEEMLEEIFEEKEPMRQRVYMSLLPEEVLFDERSIQLEYRWIEGEGGERQDTMMVILTDITEKREMESLIEEEKSIFEMVVRVVSNFSDFNVTIEEYQDFCHDFMAELHCTRDPLEVLDTIYRQIHTFKGSFHQFGLSNMVHRLHMLETEIKEKRCSLEPLDLHHLEQLIPREEMLSWLDESLALLKNILGDFFSLQEKTIVIDEESLQKIEEHMMNTLDPAEIVLLLPKLKKLRWKPFCEALKTYPDYVKDLASQVEKCLYPLEIEGGDMKVDLAYYRKFTKTLGHVFRNAMDHGIERPEERRALGKDEKGRIECRLFQENGSLVVEISDDGRGISTEEMKGGGELSSAEHMSSQEILQKIFEEDYSTREDLSHLSGRGVGLSAVKEEVHRLGGKIHVDNRPGEGVTFMFSLPLEDHGVRPSISYDHHFLLFLKGAKRVLEEQAGLVMERPVQSRINITHRMRLFDLTTILPLKGMIRGRLLFTVERELCSYMLHHFALWDVEEEEQEDSYNDLLAELLNIIIGRSLKSHSEWGDLIVTGIGEQLKASQASLKYGGEGMLTYIEKTHKGSLGFSFLPGTGDFFIREE